MAMSTDQLTSWIRVTEKMAGELAKHGLDLVEIQEVISKNGDTKQGQKYTWVRNNENNELGQYFLDKMITRVFDRINSTNGRMPYMVLTGRWCGIATLNVHAHSEN